MDVVVPETPGIHHLGEGFSLEWLHNRRIVVFETDNVRRETVDLHSAVYLSIVRNWNPLQPLLVMLIASGQNIGFTPYLRNELYEVMKVSKSRRLHGRFALVLPRTPFVQVAQLFMRAARNERQGALQPQIFHDREKAIEWLAEML